MSTAKNYAYLVGRVRVLERGLLTPRILDALLRAEDLEQALRVVAEIPYLGEAFQGIVLNPQSIDRVLNEHFSGIVGDFAKEKEGEDVAGFFLLTFDTTALKLAVKHFMLRKPLEKTYLASFDPRKVIRFLSGEGSEYFPEHLVQTLREIQELLESHPGNVQGVEFICDRFFLKGTYNLAKRMQGPLQKWYYLYIIFAYLRSAFRARYQERKPDTLRLLYFDNTLLGEKELLEMLSLSDEKIPEYLEHLGFAFVLPEAGAFRNDPYYIAEVERKMDNYLLSFLRQHRWETFGPEPIFGFLFAKFIDMKNLRILLEGKYFGLEGDVLRRKLRECYYE
ncbi:MAG: V-type ATPase subunit [Candidatus Caldatribacterium sp.]|uniref:V-type ATPase subunit n=1 Tax=Candidatus Caldatribacterium sp. TaxID=2282143 RepID=UPI0029977E9D|nr:V-type ATPase subunit [Candidatus Caldatribacterium sp.]MCX7730471.1 V-type ATPase subunit [Candidatus Caldatribacterium sp.]MDW8081367.1 V-type ATPase subunit [Candidatus Calescibacterium sp.]